MFASSQRTHSNPVTVAAMIRQNGLSAVRKSGLISESSIGRALKCEVLELWARGVEPGVIAEKTGIRTGAVNRMITDSFTGKALIDVRVTEHIRALLGAEADVRGLTVSELCGLVLVAALQDGLIGEIVDGTQSNGGTDAQNI